ncbi:MAG: hypothetical protein NC548_63835 [Lachnospiraceae bacterium]|nr:hypothetical protein [Lachnospiraceae bacterium]
MRITIETPPFKAGSTVRTGRREKEIPENGDGRGGNLIGGRNQCRRPADERAPSRGVCIDSAYRSKMG